MAKKKKLSDKRKVREFFGNFLSDRRSAEPACPHFGDCGGCEFQDVPYPDQLAAKRRAFDYILGEVINGIAEQAEAADNEDEAARLRGKVDRLNAAFADQAPDIVASPMPLGYRQRMDYVFAFGMAGLRRVNRHRQVVELEACPLLGEECFAIVKKARRLADAAGLESYDYMRHNGELRYFVVRRSRNGEVLLSLVTKTEEPRDRILSLLETLYKDGDIASGHWLLAPGLGDVSFGKEMAHVGAASIAESMNGATLRIGPNTFFQSNPAVAEIAYAAIRDFVPSGGVALDLYSGVGSIALTVAGKAGSVTAVENVPENVALAQENIRANAIANVELITDSSARYLEERTADPSAQPIDFMAVNPPRPGVEGGGMEALQRLGPKRLAYLSCNPFTLFRNVAEILDRYRVLSTTIYDMFPQTRHFETLALMERID